MRLEQVENIFLMRKKCIIFFNEGKKKKKKGGGIVCLKNGYKLELFVGGELRCGFNSVQYNSRFETKTLE